MRPKRRPCCPRPNCRPMPWRSRKRACNWSRQKWPGCKARSIRPKAWPWRRTPPCAHTATAPAAPMPTGCCPRSPSTAATMPAAMPNCWPRRSKRAAPAMRCAPAWPTRPRHAGPSCATPQPPRPAGAPTSRPTAPAASCPRHWPPGCTISAACWRTPRATWARPPATTCKAMRRPWKAASCAARSRPPSISATVSPASTTTNRPSNGCSAHWTWRAPPAGRAASAPARRIRPKPCASWGAWPRPKTCCAKRC
ncbi:hypothetical protein D3C87_1053310 [compost metagenome]